MICSKALPGSRRARADAARDGEGDGAGATARVVRDRLGVGLPSLHGGAMGSRGLVRLARARATTRAEKGGAL
jgi:hypothetical protein